MESGWIKLHRSMLEWEWWGDDRMVKMFLYLLLSCNTEPGKFRGVDILPGEVIIGRKMLAERLHMDERAVRATLDKLVSTGEIARWTNNHFTKITVKNWQKYQFANQLSNQQPTNSQPFVQQNGAVLPSKSEASDQKSANHLSNQTPTNCPTTCHKQEVRIIKENPLTGVKEKNPAESAKRFSKPSVEDVAAYCRERRNTVDPQRFWDYYESRGWTVGRAPMKDWKAAVRTWERYSNGQGQTQARSGWSQTERNDEIPF